MTNFFRVLRWKTSNLILGGIFPGITISQVKYGELQLTLRADGFVLIKDKGGSQDALPITLISPPLAIELINAQRWPWTNPVTLSQLEESA